MSTSESPKPQEQALVLSTFTNGSHQLEAALWRGRPAISVKSVCEALDLGNVTRAVSALDPDEYGKAVVATAGGPQEMLVVNEGGFYHLVLTSRKPEAKAIRRWVTDEVLPALARTGTYSTSAPLDPATMRARAAQIRAHASVTRAQAQLASAQARIAATTAAPALAEAAKYRALARLVGKGHVSRDEVRAQLGLPPAPPPPKRSPIIDRVNAWLPNAPDGFTLAQALQALGLPNVRANQTAVGTALAAAGLVVERHKVRGVRERVYSRPAN